MSLFDDQKEFLVASDCEEINFKNEQLYTDLIREEFKEFIDEPYYLSEHDKNSIKESLDILYVTVGYLNVCIGADKAKECWDALHQNNMSKCTDGKLVKDCNGKVTKPEGYVKLDLSEILSEATK